MNYKDTLQQDLITAMRSHDDTRKWVVKMLKSAIQIAELNQGGELDQNAFLALVQKEIKTRHEAIHDAERAHRTDLIQQGQLEIKILETYLPQQLSENDLRALTIETIAECQATTVKDMGRVIKALLVKLDGRATNADASRMVKDCLNELPR